MCSLTNWKQLQLVSASHYKKAFQSTANYTLANRCVNYIVNKFGQVGVCVCVEGGSWSPHVVGGLQATKFEHVKGESHVTSDEILPPMRIEPRTSHSKSNTVSFELIWHVLLRGSLNFCSCTTWFLDLDDLVRINRASQHKEPAVLQANTNLAQKGES